MCLALACTPEDTGTTEATTEATTSGTETTEGPTTDPSTTDPSTSEGTTETTEATDSEATEATETTETETTTTDPSDTEDTGAVPCSEDPFPEENSPCETEGEFCSPGCEDPCSFCNLLMCEGGVWQPAEVFPAECLSCEEICPFVVDAGCPGGAPDQESCIAGCHDSMAACGLEFNKMLACAGGEPQFSCDEMERPEVEGCESQFEELYACLGQ